MLSRHQQQRASPLRRPAHLQAQQGAGASPSSSVNVEPLPTWTICPGAPRVYPIPLPPIPAEQQYGLYTPPSSPPLSPQQLAPASSPSYGVHRSPSSPRPRGYNQAASVNQSLFPDEDMDMSESAGAYQPGYYGNGNNMVWSATGPTANELWLQRTQPTQNAYGGTSYDRSWMPAPSSSVNMRAQPSTSYAPASPSAASSRRVRFNNEDDDEGVGYGYGPQGSNRNGGGGGGGRGYGSAGSKRAWAGRRYPTGGEADQDGEDHEEDEDEEAVPRVRRRGR